MAESRQAGGGRRASFADPQLARKKLMVLAVLSGLLAHELPDISEVTRHLAGRARFRTYDFLLGIRDTVEQGKFGFTRRSEPASVVVVGIDERSLEKHGRWPWPRRRIAELISGLKELGARTTAIDILLSEPERVPLTQVENAILDIPEEGRGPVAELARVVERELGEGEAQFPGLSLKSTGEWSLVRDGHDKYLALAIREAGNVVLGSVLEWHGSATAQINWRTPLSEAPPPLPAVEVIRARRPEITLEEIEERWRRGNLFPMFADDVRGMTLIPVSGAAGRHFQELKSSGRLNDAQISKLRGVRISLEVGKEDVDGVYVSRGPFLLAAAGVGYMNDDPEGGDNVPRSVSLSKAFLRYGLPHLSVASLQHFLGGHTSLWLDDGGDPLEFRITREPDGRGEILARFPCDYRARHWVNYYPSAHQGAASLRRGTLASGDPESSNPQLALEQVSAGDVIDAASGVLSEEERDELIRRLEGRMAFVGVTALGLTDIKPTPLGEFRPGVEVHATAAANLIQGELLTMGTAEIVFGFLFSNVLLLILAVVLPRVSPLRALGWLIGLSAVAMSVCAGLFFMGSIVMPWDLLFPLVVFFTLGMTYLNLHENQDKAWIEDMFKRYVAPEYVEELKRNKGELALGGRELEITAFFTDLVSFSTLSEKFSAERLFTFLGEYLGEMTEILDGHGGTLDKYQGDAVVAFFGAPISREDHAIRACLAAIDMRDRLRELNKEWQETERYPELVGMSETVGRWWQVRARIGLNSGPCATGHLGTAERGNYTMMGDNVNLAARLEGACKPYRIDIGISDTTFEAVKDQVVCREVDFIRVVGKTVPARIYELVGRRGQVDEGIMKRIQAFELSLERYKARQFDKALDGFSDLLRDGPHDRLVEMYIDRCVRYLNVPPPKDWDGVTELTSK